LNADRAPQLKASVRTLPDMRKGYSVAIYVVGGWLVIVAVFIGSCAIKTNKLNRAFTRIKIGDSKHQVVSTLGEPSRIDDCAAPDQTPLSRCVEILHYSSFPYRWMFVMDSGGTVQAKYQHTRF